MSISNKLEKIIEPYLNYSNLNLYHYTKNPDLIFNSGYLNLSADKALRESGHSELQVGSDHIIRKLLTDYNLHNHAGIFLDYKKRGIAVYTFSCCEDAQSNHHLKYGKYCIKLTKKFLNKQIRYHAKQGIPLLVGKVIYEKERQIEIVDNIINCYKRYHKNYPDDLANLMLYLTLIIPLFKPIQDKNDKEYRIISYQIISPSGWKYFPIGVEKISFGSNEVIQLESK